MLFVEVNNEAILKIFKYNSTEEIYMPIKSSVVIDGVNNANTENINFLHFIEGMLYVLGLDNTFKYNDNYHKILKSNFELISKLAKTSIYNCIKNESYMDAFFMLKGYSSLEESEEVFEKLLWLSDMLRLKSSEFKEEEVQIIEKAKELKLNVANLYEANVLYNDKKFYEALNALNLYSSNGGVMNDELLALKNDLQSLNNYARGKEEVYNNPVKALELLIPLLEQFENDAVLYYYIAVAYRIINNHEKAIYYLNESQYIDNEFVDVVNELGLNYACLGHYDEAIKYFEAAFKATNSIEICTNLIMSYINLGDIKNANKYFDLAKNINNSDEILNQVEEVLKNFK